MNGLDVRIIEFTERLPVGNAEIEHAAVYNESVISQEAVVDLISTGMWIHPNPFVIFTTKDQYENVFGPIPQSE